MPKHCQWQSELSCKSTLSPVGMCWREAVEMLRCWLRKASKRSVREAGGYLAARGIWYKGEIGALAPVAALRGALRRGAWRRRRRASRRCVICPCEKEMKAAAMRRLRRGRRGTW